MFRFRRPGREGALLILVLCLAALLRSLGLTFQSYWSDELFSAFVSHPTHSLREVYTLTLEDVHPPLYQILLWGVYKVFAYHELSGRLLSVVVGTVGVLGTYFLGKEVSGRRTGLYAALIASLNAFLIYYSQENRSYALLFALSSFSYLYFLRTLHAPKIGNLVGYAVLTGLTIHTHHFGICLAISQALCLVMHLLFVSKDRWRLVVYAGVVGVALAVSLLPQLDYIVSDAESKVGWIRAPKLWHFPRYFVEYVRSPVLLGLFAVLLVLAVRRMLTSREEVAIREKPALLLVCAALCYAVAVTISLTLAPVLSVKNTTIVVPLLVVLVACGLDSIRLDLLRRGVVAAIVLFSLAHLFLEPGYYTTRTKDDWRSAAQEIALTQPDAPAYGELVTRDKLNVYFEWQGLPMRTDGIDPIRKLLRQQRPPEVFWLVGPHRRPPPQTSIGKLLEQFDLVEIARIERLAITAMLVRAPTPASEK